MINKIVALTALLLATITITSTISNPPITDPGLSTGFYTIDPKDRESAEIARTVLEAAFNNHYLNNELEYLANMTQGPIIVSTHNIPGNTLLSVPGHTFTLIDPSQIKPYFFDETGNSKLSQGYYPVFLQFWEITIDGDDAHVILSLSYHSGPKNGDRVIGWGGAEVYLRKVDDSWMVRIFDVRFV
ncbi:MAG: hypothetical protein NTV61_02455 [Candidatus Bathyarchaeota archaeon]|nr:hypothetical protein [Candidatus Bathyarchaeota archaeon]